MRPEEFDRKMDDRAIRREQLVDCIEEKKLLERDKLIKRLANKLLNQFHLEDTRNVGERKAAWDIAKEILSIPELVIVGEELIDLIEDALCEFAPSIYSRSICREDIENWLNERGG